MLAARHIKEFCGGNVEIDIAIKDMLDTVSQSWEVFHIIVNPVPYQQVVATWSDLLGIRALRLEDPDLLAEVILSAIRVNEGETADVVAADWDGNTALVIRNAVSALEIKVGSTNNAVVRM